MSRLLRALVLLLLAGTFLAASFVGGLVHSVVGDFARGFSAAWWWAGGAAVLALLAWRWRRRTSAPSVPPPPRS